MDINDAGLQNKIDTAINLNALLAIEEISRLQGKCVEDIICDFICSKTGKLLYDRDSKLWWSSPIEIAEMYNNEINSVAS